MSEFTLTFVSSLAQGGTWRAYSPARQAPSQRAAAAIFQTGTGFYRFPTALGVSHA